MKCPVCKNKDNEHKEKRDDNGIMGTGFSSWVTEEYYVCKKCGVMFKDVTK